VKPIHVCDRTLSYYYFAPRNTQLRCLVSGNSTSVPGRSVQVTMKRPVRWGSQVEIVHSGQFYLLLLGKHISISWDQGSHLLVHISAQYRVRTLRLTARSLFYQSQGVHYQSFLCTVCSGILLTMLTAVGRVECVVSAVTLMESRTTTW